MSFQLQYTSLDEIQSTYDDLQKTFRAGKARPLAWRQHQLRQLLLMLNENQQAIVGALQADLNKPAAESLLGEVGAGIRTAERTLARVEEWVKPELVAVDEWQQSWSPTINKTPKGVVLIISPWNYPFILNIQPLIGAISAGCPAVLKPSEISAHTSALLADLIHKYLDNSTYRVVNGAVKETTYLLELKWDHIFYTGNSKVARIIATAAAKHLTPCTLELGGKSPVVVDAAHTDLKLAAKRILWGKTTNAGQICVAPDYILIPRDAQDAFIEALKEAYSTFHPGGALGSDSYGSIVSKGHYDRLQDLIKRTTAKPVIGGGSDGQRTIEPTVYRDVTQGDALLEGEIFGPLLPLVPVDNIQEAIEFINERSHPLALYVFTDDPEVKQAFVEQTLSGSLVFNDVFQHLSVGELPFQGIGESGYGAQHLKYTFDGFTHHRATVDIPFSAEPILARRYPPYQKA
ncbi:aldehyde dehydrogenase [Artomyces pyxidatus]|uniref:Aldehyde dehydrogenase n=1 Tax=Artomyces pyxidatus TaxID=48021 RepID=A0ACB8SWI5_9AGAM|nr:aldehyde dehydrogenase [Artomyces pyxidatus]